MNYMKFQSITVKTALKSVDIKLALSLTIVYMT